MTVQLKTGRGETLKLGRQIGVGGEGKVFAIDGNGGIAAKIYRPEIRQSRKDKIITVVEEKWHTTASEVAFPIDSLWGNNGEFMGFSMRMIGGRRPIHEAYNPSTRRQHFPKASFPFLVRIALNAANAVAKVHATGCVVGDLNHSGFLVAPDATVSLIDADSFQVRSKGKLFPCRVGVPEYTAPELQGVNLSSVLRTANHDAFGLAVLIFYILFLGRHPCSGRPRTGANSPELGDAIKNCMFAYGAQSALAPPPHGPTLQDLPSGLSSMFEHAFSAKGLSTPRPSAAQWIKALSAAEKHIKPCGVVKHHHHFRDAANCPWCRMERGVPGFHAFQPTSLPISGSSQVDVGQYMAALQSITALGEAPALEDVVSKPGKITASPAVKLVRRNRWKRLSIAIALSVAMVCAAVGAVWLKFLPVLSASVLAVFVSLCAIAIGLRRAPTDVTLRQSITKARRDWETCQSEWRDATSDNALAQLKQVAERSLHELQALPQMERQKIKELTDNRQSAQRLRHLERYVLADAGLRSLTARRLRNFAKAGL